MGQEAVRLFSCTAACCPLPPSPIHTRARALGHAIAHTSRMIHQGRAVVGESPLAHPRPAYLSVCLAPACPPPCSPCHPQDLTATANDPLDLLASACPALESLAITHSHLHSAAALRLLAAAPPLTHLSLGRYMADSVDDISNLITALSSMPTLQQLSLSKTFNKNVGTVDASPLAALTRLQSLELKLDGATLYGLDQIAMQCTMLRTLGLSRLDVAAPAPGQQQPGQQPWPALEELSLSSRYANFVLLCLSRALASQAPALRLLKLKGITVGYMQPLSEMTAGLLAAAPASLAQLELGLDFEFSSMPPGALPALAPLSSKLTALTIRGSGGVYGDFEWGAAAGLLPLMPRLQHLTVGWAEDTTSLTDSLACYNLVRQCRSLRTLTLKRVRLPESAVLCAAQFAQTDAQRTSPLTIRLCDVQLPSAAAEAVKAAWDQAVAELPGPPRVTIELRGGGGGGGADDDDA